VNRYLETNIKDIYVGDCAEQREAIDERRPIEAVWYTGRMMGEALAQTLTGKPTQYKPDIGSIPLNFRHRIPNLRMGFCKTTGT
jgi:hypothetical protein